MFSGLVEKQRQQDEAKKTLAEIQAMLRDPKLSAEERSTLEQHSCALAGSILHPWIPLSVGRLATMAAIILFGLVEAAVGNYQPMIYWILLPFFSPRLMGEAAFSLGKLRGFYSRQITARPPQE